MSFVRHGVRNTADSVWGYVHLTCSTGPNRIALLGADIAPKSDAINNAIVAHLRPLVSSNARPYAGSWRVMTRERY